MNDTKLEGCDEVALALERALSGVREETASAVPPMLDPPVVGDHLQALLERSNPPATGNLASRGGAAPASLGGITAHVGPPPTEPSDLLSFYETRPLSKALLDAGWSLERDVQILVNIAESGDKDAARLAARDRLRILIAEALEAEGQRVQVHESRTLDPGHTMHVTGNINKTIKNLQGKFAKAPGTPALPESLPCPTPSLP